MKLREVLDVYRGYRIPHFKIIEHKSWWFAFSGALILLSLIGIVGRGFNYSIDFEGGAQITYPLNSDATAGDIESTVTSFGYPPPQVQILQSGSQHTVAIRMESLQTPTAASASSSATGTAAPSSASATSSAAPGTATPSGSASPAVSEGGTNETQTRLVAALASQAGIKRTEVSIESVGPTWGAEISKKAVRGLIVVLVLIALYVAYRFEWTMAVGAMIALVHDLVITAGIYALTGREVTPETVIAILTILGFSLYDTVVIYDKVKENTEAPGLVARLGYVGVVDRSLNQTIMRSVNTSLVVLLPILSLLLFGGATLKDFALAMFIGTAIGAYSSIFIAAPILTIVQVRRRKPVVRAPQTRAARRPVAASAPSGDGATAATSDAAARSATARQGSGPSKPRPKNKRRPPAKRKRR
jgi:preprotein translocase subunit SecF